MLLPSHRRRAYLRGFAVTMAFLSGAFLALTLALSRNPRWATAGILAAMAIAVPGLIRPEAFSVPYRAWNRLAWVTSRFTRFVLSAICFYIVVTATGRAGSRLNLSRDAAGSVWTARRPQPPEAYLHEFTPERTGAGKGGWVRRYLSWAWDSGNLWLVVLLPFLAFLSLNQSKTANVPADVYTLF